MRTSILAALVAAACLARAQNPAANKEAALGKALSGELERSSRIFDDPRVNATLERIAAKLWPDAPFPVHVRVTDDRGVRAAVYPGGYVYVSTGLIAGTVSESELAGVLAHLIAHSVLRHGTAVPELGQSSTPAAIPVIFMGSWGSGSCSRFRERGAPVVPNAARIEHEREADAAAIRRTYDAGWDPEGLAVYFDRLADTISAAERRQLVESLPRKQEYVLDTAACAELRSRCEQRIARSGPGRRTPRERPSLRHPSSRRQ